MEVALLSHVGLRTRVLLTGSFVVAAGVVVLSWVLYAAFNQPLAAYGFLVAVFVLLVAGFVAFADRMRPRPGEQVNI